MSSQESDLKCPVQLKKCQPAIAKNRNWNVLLVKWIELI